GPACSDEVDRIGQPRVLGRSKHTLHDCDRELVGGRNVGRVFPLAGGTPNLAGALLPIGIWSVSTSHFRILSLRPRTVPPAVSLPAAGPSVSQRLPGLLPASAPRS